MKLEIALVLYVVALFAIAVAGLSMEQGPLAPLPFIPDYPEVPSGD